MEQSQSVSSVPCSGWLVVSVSGLLRCSLIAVGTRESLWQLSVCLLQDELLGLELLKRSGLELQTTQLSLLVGTRRI